MYLGHKLSLGDVFPYLDILRSLHRYTQIAAHRDGLDQPGSCLSLPQESVSFQHLQLTFNGCQSALQLIWHHIKESHRVAAASKQLQERGIRFASSRTLCS